jgi:hypothetical protein
VTACRFRVAPRFHLSADWSQRLAVGPAWQTPPEDALEALVRDSGEVGDDVLLFNLPRHLQQKWTSLMELAAECGALTGFDAFADQVADLLAFKKLAVPPGSVLDVQVLAPGQSVELMNREGWQLWGAVNLGDEAAAVVFDDLAETAPLPVRLLLQPGEGFRLPERVVRVVGWTLDRQEPDVLLLVRCPTITGRPPR